MCRAANRIESTDTTGRLLVVPTQIARKNSQLLAILRNGTTGDRDAFFLQLADEFLVAQRGALVFHVDQVGDHLLHARVGNRSTAVRLVAGGEEVFEIEYAVRGVDVLV